MFCDSPPVSRISISLIRFEGRGGLGGLIRPTADFYRSKYGVIFALQLHLGIGVSCGTWWYIGHGEGLSPIKSLHFGMVCLVIDFLYEVENKIRTKTNNQK